MGNHDSVIPCNWKKLKGECTGVATRFFQHPDLNEDAKDEIWMMALCYECAQLIDNANGLNQFGAIEISREEYLTYKVMMM
jgi:hypothetical protein